MNTIRIYCGCSIHVTALVIGRKQQKDVKLFDICNAEWQTHFF